MKSLKNVKAVDTSVTDSIKRTRKPLFKTVSLSKLNKDSELYQHYLAGNLTKKALLNSPENPFIIAFFYNEIYDIKEYLIHLTRNEISNQSYNIIKHYSKGFDVDFINKLTSIDDKLNRFLRGELYRICEVDQSVSEHPFDDDPHVFIGYCTIGNTLLPIFEESFNLILSVNRISTGVLVNILDEFGYIAGSNNVATSFILKNFDLCFDSLIRENAISKILDSIDFNCIKSEQIVQICNNRDSEAESLRKVFLIEDDYTFYSIIIQISSRFDIYVKIKEDVYKRIDDSIKVDLMKKRDLIFSFLIVGLYHEPNSFDISLFKNICQKLQMDESRAYGLAMKLPNFSVSDSVEQFKDRIANSRDIVNLSTIFLEFRYFCLSNQLSFESTNQLSLESILDLPDKFFSIALNCIDTESARNLKIFHNNLLDERLKMHVHKKIDRDIFIKYLIKRYKLFNIDITGYEYLMDDKYKIMYGAYNTEWACKNIDELKRIGITEKLYNAIKTKNNNGCLDGVIPVDRIVCSDINEESKRIKSCSVEEDLSENDEESENINIDEESENININEESEDMNIDEESENININEESEDMNINEESEDISKSNDESNTESEDMNIDEESNNESEESNDKLSGSNDKLNESGGIDNLHANTVLQNIFNKIKDEIVEVPDDIENTQEYVYIIQSLFDWTKNNKFFIVFVEFFKKSVGLFTVKYSQIKNILFSSFNKFKDTEILEYISSSLNVSDVPVLIDDCMLLQGGHVNSLIDSIIKGLATRFRKQTPTMEDHNLIRHLVNSNSVNHVTVGASLFSLLENPEFNLDHLLLFRRDDVVLEAVKQLKKSSNDVLIKILFTRGLTDELSAEICRKLDLSTLTEKDMNRIYSLFYLNPLNFIKYEIYEHGFNLDEHIVIDLIRQLPDVFSESLFSKITGILNTFEMTQCCYDQMIISLENSNYMFKEWVFNRISTDNITLPFFIKLCWFICNEDDLNILKKALHVLKKGRSFDIIDKWAKMKKFDRLTRRIYPLKMTDRNFYNEIFSKIENSEEKQILTEVYDLN